MRHNKSFNHLGRQRGHRRSMLKNLAISLIEHKRISTTLAKAKALRVYVEPILTKSKDNSTHGRRMAFRYLQNKEAVKELFAEVAPKIADRPGGYVRVIRTGTRLGDNAETAIIELVDFNPDYNPKAEAKSGRTRRSRRRRGSSASAKTSPDTTAATEPTEADAATAEPDVTTVPAVDEVASQQVTETDQLAQVQETTPEGDAEASGTGEGTEPITDTDTDPEVKA